MAGLGSMYERPYYQKEKEGGQPLVANSSSWECLVASSTTRRWWWAGGGCVSGVCYATVGDQLHVIYKWVYPHNIAAWKSGMIPGDHVEVLIKVTALYARETRRCTLDARIGVFVTNCFYVNCFYVKASAKRQQIYDTRCGIYSCYDCSVN